jgi:hypothetical protein
VLTRKNLKRASFTHSTVYLCLLVAWVIPGLHPEEFIFGMAHGIGWFVMCALMIEGLRRRLVDIRLATAVAILGAVGPFIGTWEFVRQDRARARATATS